MAGVGDEAALTVERGLQAGEHLVEGAGQLGELIASLEVDAAAEVALADGVRGPGDSLDRAHGTVGQQQSAEEGNNQHTQAPEEQGDDETVQLIR